MSEMNHSSRRFERIGVPIISAILGGLAVYIYAHAQENTITKETIDTRKLLEKTTACSSDPLHIAIDGRSNVIADARCRGASVVDIMNKPNEATLSPIASVAEATAIEGICRTKGQSVTSTKKEDFESDEWVKVKLDTQEGIVYKSAATQGFVSALDVVGEGSLPLCDSLPIESI